MSDPAPLPRAAALVLAALLSSSLVGEAHAQSFLKALAREAAQRAAAAALQNASRPQASPPAEVATEVPAAQNEPPAGEPAAQEEAEAATATTGPAPWPVNVGDRKVTSPTQLTFAPEVEAAKKAFVDFSKVRCNDCEGGYAYDAWAQHHVKVGYEYNAFQNKIGGLAIGQSVTWKGVQSQGSITAVGDTPVNGFRCKQVTWELKKGQQRAERAGLYCFNPGADPARGHWVEVI